VFLFLLALSLLGGARIFLFVLNRLVFGSHRKERSPWHWLLWVTPPVLIALPFFFWPMHFITAAIGAYWLMDRARVLGLRGQPVAGTRTLPSEIVRLRKAHIPFATLRNLGAHNDVYDIEVTHHEIAIADLPASFDGYRIAFLTDTHVASFMRRGFYREVVAQVARFEADLVLLGGDFVTWERHIPLMAELLLTDLTARDGVYAVLGNHDYWANADGVVAAMTARGVRFVVNRAITIRRGDDAIALAGIDEAYRGEPDVVGTFALVDPKMPCIAISHHPDIIDSLRDRRIDLLLCGHTHGGQIRFPFFGAVVVPSKHEGRYAAGFHRAESVLMYVSRGIGAVPPLRILCRPEVATFVLRASPNAHDTLRALAQD
jgi:predicted MPP superfamily phosphohydrolase